MPERWSKSARVLLKLLADVDPTETGLEKSVFSVKQNVLSSQIWMHFYILSKYYFTFVVMSCFLLFFHRELTESRCLDSKIHAFSFSVSDPQIYKWEELILSSGVNLLALQWKTWVNKSSSVKHRYASCVMWVSWNQEHSENCVCHQQLLTNKVDMSWAGNITLIDRHVTVIRYLDKWGISEHFAL